MIKELDLTQTLSKEEYREKIAKLQSRIGELQRELRNEKIPMMIVFEGYDAAGKGVQIGKLIKGLDPRGFKVFTFNKENEEECMRPFMWRFWTKIPEDGRIALYDTSWYRKVLIDRFEDKPDRIEIGDDYETIRSFEKQLTAGGMAIVKLFLVISQKEQSRRFRKLESSYETSWMVDKDDLKRNKHFDEYQNIAEEVLEKTDTDYAPWNLIESTDKYYAAVKIYEIVIRNMEIALEKKKNPVEVVRSAEPATEFSEHILSRIEPYQEMEKEDYQVRVKELQKKLKKLHGEMYRLRIPVVVAFEGWDAGGKGGAILRLTDKMDPRGYYVVPTAAPNDYEKAHHYLWRFWKEVPKAGHMTIFDRTWYGRVMVERIEGFCTEDEWKRAYHEINSMEQDWVNSGVVVCKFWMQIDKDEQLRRFEDRKNNPEKQWKITEEDYRNRDKWEAYEQAVDEMILRTSTEAAPWTIVEGNNKLFARVKVLETVVNAIKKRVKEEKKRRGNDN